MARFRMLLPAFDKFGEDALSPFARAVFAASSYATFE